MGIGAVVVGAVLVVAVTIPILRNLLEERRWQVGACVDYYPATVVEVDVDAHVVDCTDTTAKSRIVGIAEPDASCESRGWLATITRGSRTYCLIRT